MGFFDRGKAPASSAQKPGNTKKGDTDPTRPYVNHDGPIRPGGDPRGDTIDYGPRKGGFSFKGLTSPRWSDRDPRFDYTPEQLAAEAAARQPYIDKRNALLGGDEAFMAAKGAGDLKGQLAAMQALRSQLMKGRFLDQGGSEETWANRFSPDANWPVPKSPLGIASHGPGRPDFPDAATMAQNGGASSGANEIQGWLGDGTASPDAAPTPRQGMPDWAKAQGGPSDVLAALSRIQSMPIGAPTAATGSPGGFARAASGIAPAMSAAVKKPTIVRRGGGVVTRA